MLIDWNNKLHYLLYHQKPSILGNYYVKLFTYQHSHFSLKGIKVVQLLFPKNIKKKHRNFEQQLPCVYKLVG